MKISVDQIEGQGIWLEVYSEMDDDMSINLWLDKKKASDLCKDLESALYDMMVEEHGLA